ncbi:MAG: hypothetical protein IJ493_03215 [Clostridia bacterium]|nr:hypothetical protein [Clostridia bacterium]
MKACVIQPPYSMDASLMDAYFEKKLELLNQCDESMDIIVLPEYSDVPCYAGTREENLAAYRKYSPRLLAAVSATAKRCNAVVFVNGLYETETGFRNTTYAFNRQGEVVGHYYKKHLPPSEQYEVKLDSAYTFEYSEPYVLEIDGIRYGFLTCYDFYFYEAFANIARQNVDIIIGCSLQRSDTHEALEIMGRFLAYNCNAHLLRASVSLDGSPDICGASMIVTPRGQVLVNMKSQVGLGVAEFNPADKYYKPAGFGNPPAPHYEYIEFGRHPWQYRPSGPAMIAPDEFLPYPRVCAHRGFNTIAPENSLPAFGAAVAMGAQEIEFDLWATKDGEIVSIHDPNLDRVSDGKGFVGDYTYDELLKFDFGFKHGAEFTGMRILTLEEILRKFACQTIMNVHIKAKDDINPLPAETLEKIVSLIRKYDCAKYCYFMSGNPAILEQLRQIAPDIVRCAGATGDPFEDLVDKALATGSKKIQLFQPHFKRNPPDYVRKTVEKAHAHGLICNVFYADDPAEAEQYLRDGCDVILTNDYQRVAAAVKAYQKK